MRASILNIYIYTIFLPNSFLYPLLQPFWRVWNAAGSDGRGVIGTFPALETPRKFTVLCSNTLHFYDRCFGG